MSFEQTIYNRFRQAGYTEAAALGFCGNWKAESGCEPYRLQNDFNSFRTPSKQYTADVESGAISKQTFISDQKGYGLAQWTYYDFVSGQGRKLDLYNFWKKRGGKLDDINMQIDFALWELSHTYTHVAAKVKNNNDLFSCVDTICRQYEQPYYCNVQERFRYAKEIMSQIDLSGTVSEKETVDESVDETPTAVDEPETDDEGIPVPKTWPPRTIDSHCSGWPEVWMLQSMLHCRGYNVLMDGIWGSVLTDKVRKFQRENGLEDDGVVGKNTYIKLGIDPAVFERR